jgi:phage-related protein
MADAEPRPAKRIVWLGQTLKDMADMPESVRIAFSAALRQAQEWLTPDSAHPFPDVGPGVYHVKQDDAGNTYRGFYVANLGIVVYVLDVFQKKSTSGIATPRKDVDRIRGRYQAAKQLHQE